MSYQDDYLNWLSKSPLKNKYEIHLNQTQDKISLVILYPNHYENGFLFDRIEDVLNKILELEKQ